MAVIAFSAVGASAAGDIPGYRGTLHGALLDILEDLGHRLVEPGDAEATHFVAFNHDRASLAAVAHRVPTDRRVLVVYEPRVVMPANYRRAVRRQYGRVIMMFATKSGPYLEWPQRDWRSRPPTVGRHVPGTSSLVNANKLSCIRGSLYGLRRRVIACFAKEKLPLSLAGANWARRGGAVFVENARAIAYAVVHRQLVDPREWARTVPTTGSITHLGTVDDKDAVLLDTEFAVIIENSATYVSEKLFDAVIAGCVPLYVGPPLADYGIPESVAVVLPPEPGSFTRAVRTLTTERKRAVLDAGVAWLGDDETYRRWAMPHALARLAEELHTHLETEDGTR